MAIGYLLDDGSIDPVLGKRIKTGDLGMKDSEGFVRVTGRTKDLIIRGGVNIAPLEIDEILLKHAGVAEAAAVGVPDKIYGEEVICYVVAKDKALTEAAAAGAQPQVPAAGQDAEAGADRGGPAQKRPRQGAARQAPRGLGRRGKRSQAPASLMHRCTLSQLHEKPAPPHQLMNWLSCFNHYSPNPLTPTLSQWERAPPMLNESLSASTIAIEPPDPWRARG